jgi:ABC-type lipoprotein export system ATPase subunit
MTLVQCENLVKIYTQTGVDVAALQGLDLSVDVGEMIAIVGESGSGKSTLLNVLGGLDRPSAGKAVVAGQELLHMSEAQLDHYRCTQVGFVWQQTTRNLTPYLSALENIELPMRLTGRSALQRRARAHELLERVGLAARAHHLPAQLSGGEQQRIAIAVALANAPPLLLADEPTGELDTATAIRIYELLKSVNQSEQTTILIVSHDPTIQRHVGRVVAIRDGKTSTETVRVAKTVRVAQAASDQLESSPVAPIHAQFEELLMLDNAGRVQIPKEALEQSRIGSRVRLEVQDDRVILHGVEGYRREVQPVTEQEEGVILIEEEPIPEPKQNALRERVSAWLRRRTQ